MDAKKVDYPGPTHFERSVACDPWRFQKVSDDISWYRDKLTTLRVVRQEGQSLEPKKKKKKKKKKENKKKLNTRR